MGAARTRLATDFVSLADEARQAVRVLLRGLIAAIVAGGSRGSSSDWRLKNPADDSARRLALSGSRSVLMLNAASSIDEHGARSHDPLQLVRSRGWDWP